MGRGVTATTSGKIRPVVIIKNGALQPNYQKYINAPIVTLTTSNGFNRSTGPTSCSCSWPGEWGAGTDSDPLYGNFHCQVRINFTTEAIGMKCTVTWTAHASARANVSVQIYNNNGNIYRSTEAGTPCYVSNRTSTFLIDQENFYFIVKGDWNNGWTSYWWPSGEASVSHLELE